MRQRQAATKNAQQQLTAITDRIIIIIVPMSIFPSFFIHSPSRTSVSFFCLWLCGIVLHFVFSLVHIHLDLYFHNLDFIHSHRTHIPMQKSIFVVFFFSSSSLTSCLQCSLREQNAKAS